MPDPVESGHLSRDYCPSCGADGRDHCATASGRDHKARNDWRSAWNSGYAAAVDAARADERRWAADSAERARRDLPKFTTAFEQWKPYLSMIGWGTGTPAFTRLKAALWDVREYRRASNTRGWDYEPEQVAVLLLADTFADQIAAAAADDQDDATVAWVTAGLRCRRFPFCTGCASCFTITSPTRPTGDDVSTPSGSESP